MVSEDYETIIIRCPIGEQTLIARVQRESEISGGSEIPDLQTEAAYTMLGTATWQHPRNLAQVPPNTSIHSPELSLESFYYSKVLYIGYCFPVKLQLSEKRSQQKATRTEDWISVTIPR